MPAVALPPTPPVLLLAPYQSAAYILDQMPDGGRVVGLQKGQASLTDLAVAAAERLGKGAHITMIAWEISEEDLATLQRVKEDGRAPRIELQLDHRQATGPRFEAAINALGIVNVTASATHTEIAAVTLGARGIVVRGSVGNYHDAQIEYFEIEENAELAARVVSYHAHPQTTAKTPDTKTENILAAQALDGLKPGDRVFGFTIGFSIAALVRAALDVTGPADVQVATWSAAAEQIDAIRTHPAARAFRLVIGAGYARLCRAGTRYAQRVDRIFDALGPNGARCAESHMKVATIRNDRWNLTIRSTANLTTNLRADAFDVEDNAAVADMFDAWISDTFRDVKPGAHRTRSAIEGHLKRSLGGGLSKTAYTERAPLDMAALTAPPKPYSTATMAALMAPPKQLALL